MAINKQSARIKHHTSTTTGSFTVPSSEDFTDGSWDKWDLAKSEIAVNEFDETVSVRIGSNIYEFYTTAAPISSSNIGNSDLTIDSSGARKLILGGALSTDYFVIRNSSDSADYFRTDGVGDSYFGGNIGVGVNPISAAKMYMTATSGYGILSNGANYSYGTGGFNVNGFYSAQIGNNKTAFRCENPGGGTGGTCTAFGTATWGTNTGGTYVAFDGTVGGTSGTAIGFSANVTGGATNNYAIQIVNGDYKISHSGAHKVILGGALSTDSWSFRDSSDSSNLMIIQGDGSVGIAKTPDTNATLDIQALGGTSAYKIFRARNASNTNDFFAILGDGQIKIGNAASHKVGFYGTATTAQATTGITAATFTANTSGISDDTATFDGYTIGQVVAALRTIGILA